MEGTTDALEDLRSRLAHDRLPVPLGMEGAARRRRREIAEARPAAGQRQAAIAALGPAEQGEHAFDQPGQTAIELGRRAMKHHSARPWRTARAADGARTRARANAASGRAGGCAPDTRSRSGRRR